MSDCRKCQSPMIAGKRCAACRKRYAAEYQKNLSPGQLQRKQAKSKAWFSKDPEATKAYRKIHNKKFQLANLDKFRSYGHAYRARKLGAVGTFSAEEWQAVRFLQNGKCAVCQAECKLVADHIVPLNGGGSNWIANIQGLCVSCNCSKKDKSQTAWLSDREAA